MRHSEKNRFSFYLQILLLLLLFLGVCAILMKVFAASYNLSRGAEEKTTATEICRNAAEIFSAENSAADTILRLGGTQAEAAAGTAQVSYGTDLEPAGDGAYLFSAVISAEPAGTGQMLKAHFMVSDTGGTLLAELDTEKYLPAKGGTSHAE